jgi:hypothetical protein
MAAIMVAMTRRLNQTVRPPVAPSIAFLSNTATGHLQARNLVDIVTAPLPVPPEVVKAIHAIVDPLIDPLIGAKVAPKARAGPLDVVKPLVPVGKTVRAEATDEAGVDGASEDSSSQAEAGASTSPAAGSQDAPVAAPNPPADCQSQSQPSPRSGPVRRQAPGASNGESGGSPDPNPPAPPPPVPSGPGGNVGGSPGGDVGDNSGGDVA